MVKLAKIKKTDCIKIPKGYMIPIKTVAEAKYYGSFSTWCVSADSSSVGAYLESYKSRSRGCTDALWCCVREDMVDKKESEYVEIRVSNNRYGEVMVMGNSKRIYTDPAYSLTTLVPTASKIDPYSYSKSVAIAGFIGDHVAAPPIRNNPSSLLQTLTQSYIQNKKDPKFDFGEFMGVATQVIFSAMVEALVNYEHLLGESPTHSQSIPGIPGFSDTLSNNSQNRKIPITRPTGGKNINGGDIGVSSPVKTLAGLALGITSTAGISQKEHVNNIKVLAEHFPAARESYNMIVGTIKSVYARLFEKVSKYNTNENIESEYSSGLVVFDFLAEAVRDGINNPVNPEEDKFLLDAVTAYREIKAGISQVGHNTRLVFSKQYSPDPEKIKKTFTSSVNTCNTGGAILLSDVENASEEEYDNMRKDRSPKLVLLCNKKNLLSLSHGVKKRIEELVQGCEHLTIGMSCSEILPSLILDAKVSIVFCHYDYMEEISQYRGENIPILVKDIEFFGGNGETATFHKNNYVCSESAGEEKEAFYKINGRPAEHAESCVVSGGDTEYLLAYAGISRKLNIPFSLEASIKGLGAPARKKNTPLIGSSEPSLGF